MIKKVFLKLPWGYLIGVTVNAESNVINRNDSMLESRKRQFTYAEIIKMTNNFERILGKGGFGTVYHGCLDDSSTQVAVKLLSPSSLQGYQQFQAEACSLNSCLSFL